MINRLLRQFFFSCAMLFWSIFAFAEDKNYNINVRTQHDGGGFFGTNLFWIVLAIVLIGVVFLALSSTRVGHLHREPHHHHHHD